MQTRFRCDQIRHTRPEGRVSCLLNRELCRVNRSIRRAALASAVVASLGMSSAAMAGGRPDLVSAGLNQGRPHQAGELLVKFRDGVGLAQS